MKWDLYLLRRFSSTSHFRLMAEVKNELRTRPLNRNAKTKALYLEAIPSTTFSIKDNRRFINNQINRKYDDNSKYLSDNDQNKKSFKDRLDSIDLR